jgi:hypothetical protein
MLITTTVYNSFAILFSTQLFFLVLSPNSILPPLYFELLKFNSIQFNSIYFELEIELFSILNYFELKLELF